MQESGSVITELGHSPGAEDKTESRQTEVAAICRLSCLMTATVATTLWPALLAQAYGPSFAPGRPGEEQR